MRWLAKALLQKSLSALPQAERANYVLQRHVTRSLPGPTAGFQRRFRRAVGHLDAYKEHGSGKPLAEAVFYEFGAGWDLAVPLSFWALGVERQILVDLHPNVHIGLVNVSIERLRDLPSERALREPGGSIGSLEELEPRFGIRYLAPCDARATGLPATSVDVVTSTSTLEHIPEDDLVPLLAECRRLLRPDGVLSSRIDLSDHYSHFDDSLSPYNFLRYSDRTWRLVNSPLHYQNRLREPDYLELIRDAGLELVVINPSGPSEQGRLELEALPITQRFRKYPPEELGVTVLSFVAKAPA